MQMNINNYISIYYTWFDLSNWLGIAFQGKKDNLPIQYKQK